MPEVTRGQGLTAPQFVLGAAAVAVVYVLLFELNRFLFSRMEISSHVSWVFLPAAIRMISVMLLGWAGVAGLYIGSMSLLAPSFSMDPLHAFLLAAVSSVPCLLAARIVQRLQRVSSDLAGLTGRQLAVFGLAGGLASSGAHTLYFAATAGSTAPLANFIPMFVGDTVGTFIILYLAAIVLQRVLPSAR